MTKPDFAAELKKKQQEGNLKPSDFKRNRGYSLPTASNSQGGSANIDLAQLQAELTALKKELNKVIAEKNALELALFDKRLESLKEFSHYHEKIKVLQDTELTALDLAKKQVKLLTEKLNKNTFNLALDTNTKLILTLLALALFLTILTQ